MGLSLRRMQHDPPGESRYCNHKRTDMDGRRSIYHSAKLMPTNDREYMRKYMRMRTFLYRLEHPRKTPGVKPGHKFMLRTANAKPKSRKATPEVE